MQIRRFFYAYTHNNRTDGFLTHSARNTMMRTKHDLAKIKKIEKFPQRPNKSIKHNGNYRIRFE